MLRPEQLLLLSLYSDGEEGKICSVSIARHMSGLVVGSHSQGSFVCTHWYSPSFALTETDSASSLPLNVLMDCGVKEKETVRGEGL